MMKKLLAIVVVVVIALVGANAAMAAVFNTKHDLSAVGGGTTTETCVFCHTPHQAAGANAQDPLWNRSLSQTPAYGVYSSPTMTMTPVEIVAAALGDAAVSTTHLCLSCHDGTVAVNTPLNPPNAGGIGATAVFITGNSNLGTSLADDHPVNFLYDDTKIGSGAGQDPGLALSSAIPAALPLVSGRMQCSTCHNVHDNSNAPFLRMSNAQSAMCTSCHINK